MGSIYQRLTRASRVGISRFVPCATIRKNTGIAGAGCHVVATYLRQWDRVMMATVGVSNG